MTGYDEYLQVIATLHDEGGRLAGELAQAERIGVDGVRAAERRLAEVAEESRRAQERLRSVEQGLERLTRSSGYRPQASATGTVPTTLPEIVQAAGELERDLVRTGKSAEWVQQHRSQVSAVPPRTPVVTAPPAPVVPVTVATPPQRRSPLASAWLWAGVAAVLVVVLVVVILVK